MVQEHPPYYCCILPRADLTRNTALRPVDLTDIRLLVLELLTTEDTRSLLPSSSRLWKTRVRSDTVVRCSCCAVCLTALSTEQSIPILKWKLPRSSQSH